MQGAALVLADSALWGFAHASTGYGAHRLPDRWLDRDRWLWRERSFERGGRLYSRVLRVNRWKARLPEAGALFAGGYDKRSLGGRSTAALMRYQREARRAELAHWGTAAFVPIFFAFNPWPAGLAMVVYALAANGPCVVACRYNRCRIGALLVRRSRLEERSVGLEARSAGWEGP